jgi:hypothetical protein
MWYALRYRKPSKSVWFEAIYVAHQEKSLLEDAEACVRRSQDILDKIVDGTAALESGYSNFSHGHDLPLLSQLLISMSLSKVRSRLKSQT